MNKNVKSEPGADKPAHEQIATMAYQLWEKGGRLPGRDLEYWFQAEKQLTGGFRSAPSAPILPGSGQKLLTTGRNPAPALLRKVNNGRARGETARP